MTMEGMTSLVAEFEYKGKWSRQRSYSIALHYGQRLVNAVQAHASGRPGPRSISGAYLASMHFDVEDLVAAGGLGSSVEVWTDADQALRLEYGFTGTDEKGRHYSQPPFPHWGPAADEVEPEFLASMEVISDFDAS